MTMPATTPAEASAPTARPADKAEAGRLVDTLTLAFAADPVARWMYPDPHQYLRWFPALAGAFGGGAFASGTAYLSGGYAGAALWLPPDAAPDDETLEALVAESVPEPHRDNVYAVFGEFEHHHPAGPHWYLPLLGVEPARQGEGHGSALLAHVLRLCDETGLPAYLEATSARNAALYARHGFEPKGEIRAGGCPAITPMLRPAR